MEELYEAIPKLRKIISKASLITITISFLLHIALPVMIYFIVTANMPKQSDLFIAFGVWIGLGALDLCRIFMHIFIASGYKKVYEDYMIPLYKSGRKELLLEVVRTGTPLLYVDDINFSKPSLKDYIALSMGMSNKNRYWWLVFFPLVSGFNLNYYLGCYFNTIRIQTRMNNIYNVMSYNRYWIPDDIKDLADSAIRKDEWLNS